MSSSCRRWALVVSRVCAFACALSIALGPSVARGADSPGPGDADPALYDPVLAGQRDDVLAETEGRLSRYRIAATLTPGDPARITGSVDLLFYNDTGRDLDALYLRLYANDDLYADGAIRLDAVAVNDLPIAPMLDVEETVAEVPLPAAVATGETVPVAIAFSADVPVNPSEGYGMYGVETASGTWALAHWYPVLAGYGPDGEWNLLPPSVNGDPVFTTTALYEVTLTAPEDLVLVTTGSEVATDTGDGLTSHRYLTGPVRDFTIVADDDFAVVSREVGDTTVNSWYNPGREAGAELVLDYGAASLELFNELFGTYPYEELDLADIDVGGGAAGIEFPQLMFIGDDYYDNAAIEQAMPGFLEFLVVHEVAHQWWYALVGNDQYVDAFIDEGLTNYVSTVYFERRYGEDIGDFQRALNLELPYLEVLFNVNVGDEVVDQPTDDFATMGHYGVMIYCKGALGFGAIREVIGDEAFFAGLHAYVEDFRFRVTTPDDLRAAFEAASGQDLRELWRHWFEAAEGTQDYTPEDRDEVRREVGR